MGILQEVHDDEVSSILFDDGPGYHIERRECVPHFVDHTILVPTVLSHWSAKSNVHEESNSRGLLSKLAGLLLLSQGVSNLFKASIQIDL